MAFKEAVVCISVLWPVADWLDDGLKCSVLHRSLSEKNACLKRMPV
ncbi:MAG: hypothetical protein GY706_01710 [Bacteroides sp.]|nr:hypothetical protein [Bacteroides sp.]